MENNNLFLFLAGIGIGAGLMYFLDPDRGRRRRALVRDKAVGLSNDAGLMINDVTDNLSNRAHGVAAETRKAVTGSAESSSNE